MEIKAMEIIAKTPQYTAQQLQEMINQQVIGIVLVLGGDHPNEYIIIVENDLKATLVKGMLDHIGVDYE